MKTAVSSGRPCLDLEDIKTGFQTGKGAALAEWSFRKEQREFDAQVNRLRVVKWQRENPAKHAAKNKRWKQKPGNARHLLDVAKQRRRRKHRERGVVLSCQQCGAAFCRMPCLKGPAPRFCGTACYQLAYYGEHSARPKKKCGLCGQPGHSRRTCGRRGR